MVFIFTILEISYLAVSLFYNLVRPCISICVTKHFGCTNCLIFRIATKAVIPSSTPFTIFLVGANQVKLFSNKYSL